MKAVTANEVEEWVKEDQTTVTEYPSSGPFSWVRKSNGQLVAFEADCISRDLFAATERLGQPDAFLARELTDSVLYFLGGEADGSTLTTLQIVEIVGKVLRELGHGPLARAFQEHCATAALAETEVEPLIDTSPLSSAQIGRWVDLPSSATQLTWRMGQACLRSYSLQTVFARDLAAVHASGLLILGNLEAPLELAGCVLGPTPALSGLVETIQEARNRAGDFLAVDGPEHALVYSPHVSPATYARELRLGLQATGLRAVVNLNSEAPPVWADDLAQGPLFAGQREAPSALERVLLGESLREHLLERQSGSESLRVDWHLAERDFLLENSGRLLRVARQAVDGTKLAFVFDRPRRAVHLAEGLDRQHPAILLTVGLNLPLLAEQPELRSSPDRFLQKLGCLVRLARSAATQKRDFLRRHIAVRPALSQGFAVDRGRLLLVPVGLEAVIRTLLGCSLAEGGPGLELGRQILQGLRAALVEDARGRHLDACLDSAQGFNLLDPLDQAAPSSGLLPEQVAGLAPWDAETSLCQQVRCLGQLHSVTGMGTGALLVPAERALSAEELTELLRFAWRQTDIVRVCVIKQARLQPQIPVLWSE